MTHEQLTILDDVTRALRHTQITLGACAEELEQSSRPYLAKFVREKIASNQIVIDRALAALTEACPV